MTKRRAAVPRSTVAPAAPDTAALLQELRQLIGDARRAATAAVNVSLTALDWRVGKRMRDEVLAQARAEYGEQIVATLSRQLASEYGRGFEEKNLRRMMQFAEAFPDEAIVATLWRQLSGRMQLRLSPHATVLSFLRRSVEFPRLVRRLAVSRVVPARWRFNLPTFSAKLC